MSQATDVVLALRNGDERALAEIYDRYGGAVYHLALRITHDPGSAEEITLDAFLQIWRQADRFDARHGSLAGWLFTIARSRAIDRVRAAGASKRAYTEDLNPSDQTELPDEMADLAQRRGFVRAAMAKLSTAQRTALELAYYEGLSHSQIAAQLGEPLGTVKTRIRQAMLTLRQALAPMVTST